MDREFSINDSAQVGGSSIAMRKKKWVLRELVDAYHQAYCGKIGVQFMHIAER